MFRYLPLFLFLSLSVMAQTNSNVVNSPHNMSISGPGAYKSMATARVCVFCHAPHSVIPNAPLWNREDNGQTYTQYSSSTMMSVPGQPAGSSRLCLACHDGTVALERMAVMPAGAAKSNSSRHLGGRSNLGTDLGDDHPISFDYVLDGGLADPITVNSGLGGTIDVDMLFAGKVECASCHNVHDDTISKFLLVDNARSALCLTCHLK